MVSTNFFSLYVTQWLGIESRYLAFFPILNAAVMLIFMIGIQHKLELVKFRIPMWAVSYTHLDVYKRQILDLFPRTDKVQKSAKKAIYLFP